MTTRIAGCAGVLLGLLGADRALAQAPAPMFRAADGCISCHNGLVTQAGEDLSLGSGWRPTMMANAARDPYWQATVRRELGDHPTAGPAIENECAACHMPMAAQQARARGEQAAVFAHLPAAQAATPEALLAVDGVSCVACHAMEAQDLGAAETYNGRFRIDATTPYGQRPVYGPFAIDAGRTRLMRSAAQFEPRQGAHIQAAELCASCHTLITHSLGPDGVATGELPEQMPYVEWRHSAFAATQSCQACHLPVVEGEAAIASVLGQPRQPVAWHDVRGGNFLLPLIFNRARAELGVTALAQELDASSRRAREFLASASAALAVQAVRDGDALVIDVEVRNRAGHKLPTAYPSRRAWLHLRVLDAADQVVFESGALQPDGAIAGNDNDQDPARFEPHHEVIERPDQVQIYEPILGDPQAAVTTGLIAATQYLKDNRLLPDGFDKATAPAEVQVRGAARDDTDFVAGGDRVRYRVPLGEGAHRVEVGLWYQPIGHRWAHNLARQDTAEARRFVEAYTALAAQSAQVLARAQVTLAP